MKKVLIEKIALGVVGLATLIALVVVPINSYSDYLDYLKENVNENSGSSENNNKPAKPVLESIDAELKENVKYFANDLAEAKPEHFIVKANYTLEGSEPYSEVIEEGKFEISTSANFYAEGGDVVVTYRDKTDTVKVELIPIALESLEVATKPNIAKYATGSTFNSSGMVIRAVFNDGSVKLIKEGEFIVDTTTPLKITDEKVTVSYTLDKVTKSVDVPINVSDNFDNGQVVSIDIVGDAIVSAGDLLSNTEMVVNAVYESGNIVRLNESEYTINGSSSAVELGRKYTIDVSYNKDATKKTSKEVIVRQTVEGESGTIVGGAVKTETEYVINNGVITSTEKDVTFAGNFANSVKNGNEGSLSLNVYSATQSVSDITMRCSNSYNVYANGINSNDGYVMKPLQINTILDLTINGKEVKVPDNVVLKGCGPYEKYAPLYGIYYEFTFENVTLEPGTNIIKFNFKKSTNGATNCWGESPSTLNIDYVNFDTKGNEVPSDANITSIEIANGAQLEYGTLKSEVDVSVIGVLDNGTKVGLTKDLYTLSVESPDGEDSDYFLFGEYKIIATLVSDSSIKTSTTCIIEKFVEFVVLKADILLEGERVYYVFSGNSVGYEAEDLEFFDGATTFDSDVTFTHNTFEMKIDVTDINPTTIYPHMKVGGSNYDNGGANYNGDIRDRGLTYENGKSVSLGGKTYTLKTEWSMPTLVIA